MPKRSKNPPNLDNVNKGITPQTGANLVVENILYDFSRTTIKGSGGGDRKLSLKDKISKFTSLIENSSDAVVRKEAKDALNFLNNKHNLGIDIQSIKECSPYEPVSSSTKAVRSSVKISTPTSKSKTKKVPTLSPVDQAVKDIMAIGTSSVNAQVSKAAYAVLSWIKHTRRLSFDLPDLSSYNPPKNRLFSLTPSKQKTIHDIRNILTHANLDTAYTKITESIEKHKPEQAKHTKKVK